MKKNKTLRLHRQHDLDLITLYRASGFSFAKEVRKILTAYVNCEGYDPPEIDYGDVDLSYIPTTIQYHLALDTSDPKEQAVLDMFHDEIKYGYMNAFVKALVRAYIPRIPFIGYGVENGFVTRRITANDVGAKIREAQRIEQEQTIPEMSDTNNQETIEAGSMDMNQIADENISAPIMTVPSEAIKQTEQSKMEPMSTSELTQMPNIQEADEDLDESDDDDFDDFFATAQAFTGI